MCGRTGSVGRRRVGLEGGRLGAGREFGGKRLLLLLGLGEPGVEGTELVELGLDVVLSGRTVSACESGRAGSARRAWEEWEGRGEVEGD